MEGKISPETTISTVYLNTSSLPVLVTFYCDQLGLHYQSHNEGIAEFYAPGASRPLLVVYQKEDAQRMGGTTGLYHYAVRLPTRADLARIIRRMVELRLSLQGFANHGVSEAVYLSDPDGNGIEIYVDSPRSEWPKDAGGNLLMTSDPIDLDNLMLELKGQPAEYNSFPPGSVMGHIHLHVSQIAPAENFYTNVLGFDLMQRYGPSASFLSAGGYHHHIGMNTWAGVGAPPPPEDAIGLQSYTILLPGMADLQAVKERLRNKNVSFEDHSNLIITQDPSQNGIRLET